MFRSWEDGVEATESGAPFRTEAGRVVQVVGWASVVVGDAVKAEGVHFGTHRGELFGPSLSRPVSGGIGMGKDPDSFPGEGGQGLRVDPNFGAQNGHRAHVRALLGQDEVEGREEIGANLIADIDDMFADGWPPTPEAIDDLKPGDVIVFGVESEPTEDFDLPKQELVSASVLSVGKTEVRGRVIGPVAHADHHGNSAGHGLYVGSLVEVPRPHVMVVARLKPDPEMPKTGYGSKGDPARVFVPNYGKEPYKVHPSTVYDLELPYRTEELGWTPSRENVKYAQIGDEGLRHQIMFTEASIRGPYSLTLLDDDPKEGIVFVGKWDFVIAE